MSEQEMNKMTDALQAVEDMLTRSVKMQDKFKVGSPQHTLLVNRINSLRIASSILSCELSGNDILSMYSKDALQNASVPLVSIVSKSEKVILKLKPNSWQYKMLTDNLSALDIVLTRIKKLSGDTEPSKIDSI